MNNEELQYAAQYVLDWAVRSYCQKLEEFIAAKAKETGRIEAEKEYDKDNPDDGVGSFSQNPFSRSKDYNNTVIKRLQEELDGWHNIKEFVVERICKQIEMKE